MTVVVVLAVAAAAVVAGILWIGGRGGPKVEITVVPRRGGPGGVLQAAGFIVAQRKAAISAKITGLITEVNVSRGDRVKKGFVVARLGNSDLVARRERIKEELRIAGIEEQRLKKLVKSDSRAKIEFERAESKRIQLESALAEAESRVDDTVITAPFDGVIIEKNAEVGETVSFASSGARGVSGAIATIVDETSLLAEVDVNEAHKERVRAGMRAEILLEGLKPYRGRVVTIVPAVDRAKATVQVLVAFDALDKRVLDGMSVRVRFVENEIEDLKPLTIPSACLREEGDRTIVWVVSGDTVQSRDVTIGRKQGGRVEIINGLKGGERLVLEPTSSLTDGMSVREKE